MKNIKAMVPLSVKREIKHVWNYITKKDYRIAWENNRELRQYRTSYGDRNPDKIFYVIRRTSSEAMGSVFKNCIGELEYASRKQYIPVIDCQHYFDCLIQNEDKQGMENAWEYYFQQVSPFELDEVYRSKNVVMSNALDSKHWIYREKGKKIYSSAKTRTRFSKIYKKYCVLSDNMKRNTEKEWAKLKETIGDKKVLGVCVMLREADCCVSGNLDSNYKGRALQPAFDEVVKDIRESMDGFGCDYVFISDDSDKYRGEFKKQFGDKVLFSGRKQANSAANSCGEFKRQVSQNPQEYTIGYLTDIFLLARCNSLLASECSTSQLACIINDNKYEYEKIYHLGTQ